MPGTVVTGRSAVTSWPALTIDLCSWEYLSPAVADRRVVRSIVACPNTASLSAVHVRIEMVLETRPSDADDGGLAVVLLEEEHTGEPRQAQGVDG